MRPSEKNGQNGLLDVARFGVNLLETYNHQLVDFETSIVLIVLLHLEQVLDKGRMVVDTEDQQTKFEINKGMDEIRDGIMALMKKLGKSETEALVFKEGEHRTTNFIQAAFSE
jgi:hypothetical protein